MKNTNGILIALAVVLIAMVAFAYMQKDQKTTGEKISDSVSEVTEEIQDEIDDNTTN